MVREIRNARDKHFGPWSPVVKRRSKAAERRIEAERRREPGRFIPLSCTLLKSEAFTRLSAHAVKLLFDLLSQLSGT